MTRLKFCDKIINVNECNYGYLYGVNMGEGKIMEKIEPFKQKVWLASPTMHGEELEYVTEAYNTNWMSTVGKNINEVEKIAAEKSEVKYAVGLSCCTAALHLCCKLAGERLYGKPAISHGALEGRRVFCSDMTFDATLNPVVYEGGILWRLKRLLRCILKSSW